MRIYSTEKLPGNARTDTGSCRQLDVLLRMWPASGHCHTGRGAHACKAE